MTDDLEKKWFMRHPNLAQLLVLAILLAAYFGYSALRPETERVGLVSRALSTELKEKKLISNEYEDDYLRTCMENAMKLHEKSWAARSCGCQYKAMADVALRENVRFSSVVERHASGSANQQWVNCLGGSPPPAPDVVV